MNSHDFARLLLAAPAQNLRDMGGNERYATRYDLKGLKIPGVASIGGWLYPTHETDDVPVAVTAPAIRRKALKPQVNPTPVAAVAPAVTTPAPVAKAKAPKAKAAPVETAPAAPAPAPVAGQVNLAQLAQMLATLGVTIAK